MKTQVLAPVDYGCSGETLPWYSLVVYNRDYPILTPIDYEARLREFDRTYSPNQKWTVPSPSCNQQFDSTKRKRNFAPNDVTNIKRFYKSWYFTSGYVTMFTSTKRFTSVPHSRISHNKSWVQPVVPAVNFDAMVSSNLRAEAYWTMRPRFEGEVSVINALYELKDFRDILKLINPRNLERVFKLELDPYLQKESISRTVTKTLAGLHLFDAFAVGPLFSDISQAIAQAQATVLEKQKEFGAVEENTRRFTRHWDPVQTLSAFSRNSTIGQCQGTRTTQQFTAVMEYQQRYRPLEARRAFVQYWGLNPFQVEAIWNGLPFSFLADYFFTIGKSFHAMRRDPNIDLYPRNYTESILCKTQTGGFIYPGVSANLGVLVCDTKVLGYTKPTDYSVSKPIHVTGFESSYYQRRLTTPYQGPVLPRIKVPSSKQGLNMLALLRVLL